MEISLEIENRQSVKNKVRRERNRVTDQTRRYTPYYIYGSSIDKWVCKCFVLASDDISSPDGVIRDFHNDRKKKEYLLLSFSLGPSLLFIAFSENKVQNLNLNAISGSHHTTFRFPTQTVFLRWQVPDFVFS